MKAILLLSTGIDSPVAAHLMMKRGVELVAVFFQNFPNASDSKINALAEKVGIKKLYIIPYHTVQEEIKKNTNSKLQCMFCKRFMYRIAEKLAEKENAEFLVTGENLGQVASQTLTNLTVNDKAVKVPILRPLLAFDKVETIKIAREIGTYDISIQKEPSCPYVPKHPTTGVKEEFLLKEEGRLNTNNIIEAALKSAKELDV